MRQLSLDVFALSKHKIRKSIETGAIDWATESLVACFDLMWIVTPFPIFLTAELVVI